MAGELTMDDAELVDAPDERVRDYYVQKELKEIAKHIRVPINDDDVRRQLRAIDEPAELANETKLQRRQRLTELLARKAKHASPTENEQEREDKKRGSPEPKLPKVTEGSEALMKVRQRISESVTTIRGQQQSLKGKLKALNAPQLALQASQAGFARPVAAAKLLPSSTAVSGDWSGHMIIMGLEDTMPVIQETHIGPISDIAVREETIASGGMDGTLYLHRLQDGSTLSRLAQFEAHRARIASIDLHPADGIIVTGSHDKTWCLWDYDRATCLLQQDGHGDAVNVTKISPDGSLLASGGMDKDSYIWDLRSGVCVTTLQGHASAVVTAAWHPSPPDSTMVLATGSADNRCLVWDLRNPREPLNSIYAHNNTVTDMAFDESAATLVTSSLDSRIRLWDCKNNYKLLKTLETGSRVTCLDVKGGTDETGTTVVAGRWDRLVDLYRDF